MATLIETQKKCDKSKYLESIKNGKDMSGAMEYCLSCKHSQKDYTCDITHEERVSGNLCAKAYNRYAKKK